MIKSLFSILAFLTIIVKAQSQDSLAVTMEVDSLIKVSQTLSKQRDFENAIAVNSAAEKLALERFGKESAAYGSCCSNHGRVLFFNRNYPEAEKWILEAIAIQEKVLGKDHPEYAQSLHNLAALYLNMGSFEKAEPFLLESKAIRKKVLGTEHPDYAVSLYTVGALYLNMGFYDKAEPLFLESKVIREKVLGKEHPDYALSLNALAVLYMYMGSYEKAEPIYLESKTIWEKAVGKEHPDYAVSLHNLAYLYGNMGFYEKAEPLYLESKAIREKAHGKEHPAYAMSLNNLAALYQRMGSYEKAEPLYLESRAIREKVLGQEHPDYAQSLGNLAVLYRNMGLYEKAEPLYLESIAIREKTQGKEHPDYAWGLNNLAVLYFYMGSYEKAEPLYLESKAIREKVQGKEHPDYAQSLNALATLYLTIGSYEKAELLYLEANAIREKTQGKEHPDYALSLNALATLYEIQDRYNESELLLKNYFELSQSLLSQSTTFLSEQELSGYVGTFREKGDMLSSQLLVRKKKNVPTSTLSALQYDQTLFHKGFLLTASNRLNTLAASSPDAKKLNIELKSYRRRLSAEFAKPISEQSGVAELEEKANTLEKELVRTVAGYGEAIRQVKWQEVQQALPENGAAIEFVHYQFHDPGSTDSIMYAALVLRPGQEAPHFIPLFEEKSLDSLVSLHSAHRSDYVNDLYAFQERGVVAIGKPVKSLYDMIWEPIEKELDGIETVYYSPSGLLHRLNIGAIPKDYYTTLSDSYNLIQLGSTRQLVVKHGQELNNNSALLFGGIQFEADTMAMLATNAGLVNEGNLASRSRGSFDFNATDTLLRGGKWRYLNGTDVEVSVIQQIMKHSDLKAEVIKGSSATEETFKAIGQNADSPKVLHLATHGYFFPDPASFSSRQSTVGSQETVFKISEHPMIRSGLILTGGNHAWKTGKPLLPGMEDGILTANEISQMNLSNTELVVLSACETGLGDIEGNEGVYGLQRAFKIAGAKYLIMSLWQVPDFQTQELMTTFYEKWLEEKMDIPKAFRLAQKEMREKYRSPYFWAGFVLVE